jgi:hypothetical protein
MNMPVFELWARSQVDGDEYKQFRYIWSDFEHSVSTIAGFQLESSYWFDSHTGSLTIDFEYAEYVAFRDYFLTMYSGIEFKIVARLPGSDDHGTTVDFRDLIAVDFMCKFIEPEEADACLEHRFSLTGSEVATGLARESDITVNYDIAPIGSAATEMTIYGLGVQSNNPTCTRKVIHEYW